MNQTLAFSIAIDAPRKLVWDTMLDQEDYKAWTSVFCEGSHFSGSWDEGSKIQFLAPNGDGMTAVIAENKPYEYVAIRHEGEIKGGVEDTTSESVRAWAPAYETFTFVDSGNGTEVRVSLETIPEYVEYMNETYPKALEVLKQLCESKAGQKGTATTP